MVGSDAGKAGEVGEEAPRKNKNSRVLSVSEERKQGKKIVAPNAPTEATAAGGSSIDMRNKGRAGMHGLCECKYACTYVTNAHASMHTQRYMMNIRTSMHIHMSRMRMQVCIHIYHKCACRYAYTKMHDERTYKHAYTSITNVHASMIRYAIRVHACGCDHKR
jgi:hypothetical protein